jgi:CheY-like chemotaxis protein
MPLMQRLLSLIGPYSKKQDQPGDQFLGSPERRMKRRMNARQGTRVLIIDDCSIAQAELRKLFASAGFSVAQSEEPKRGLSMACFENPELVVLNVGMPGMNGFEVLKLMRRDPLARRIPVIMISGNPRVAEYIQQLKFEADGFLRKPFTRQAIFEIIENMLDENHVPRRGNIRHHFHSPTLMKLIRQHLIRH